MISSLNTFILIDKPAGWTSFDVCAKLRKPLNIKRIGHTGTLDPFATGLLVIAVGKCTKLIPLLEKDRKIYRTKILLNKTSETLDPESEIIDCDNGVVPTQEQIETLLKEKFLGKIEQVPPQYSALKIDGKRAYDLARKGETVEMKPRSTEVFRAEVINYNYPQVEVELEVAAGFYVRSFARDVGQALCGGGMCAELRRIGVGELMINGDWPVVTDLEKIDDSYLLDPQFLIKNIVHKNMDSNRMPDWQAGRAVMMEDLPPNGEKVLVLCEGVAVGMGEVRDGNLQPRVVF